MVNLDRMSPKERLSLCRKYFFIGLAFLPLVWLVNCVWFYSYTFCSKAPESDEKKSMKKCSFITNLYQPLKLFFRHYILFRRSYFLDSFDHHLAVHLYGESSQSCTMGRSFDIHLSTWTGLKIFLHLYFSWL